MEDWGRCVGADDSVGPIANAVVIVRADRGVRPYMSFRASARREASILGVHTGVGIRTSRCRVVSPLHSKKRTTAVIRFLVL